MDFVVGFYMIGTYTYVYVHAYKVAITQKPTMQRMLPALGSMHAGRSCCHVYFAPGPPKVFNPLPFISCL